MIGRVTGAVVISAPFTVALTESVTLRASPPNVSVVEKVCGEETSPNVFFEVLEEEEFPPDPLEDVAVRVSSVVFSMNAPAGPPPTCHRTVKDCPERTLEGRSTKLTRTSADDVDVWLGLGVGVGGSGDTVACPWTMGEGRSEGIEDMCGEGSGDTLGDDDGETVSDGLGGTGDVSRRLNIYPPAAETPARRMAPRMRRGCIATFICLSCNAVA